MEAISQDNNRIGQRLKVRGRRSFKFNWGAKIALSFVMFCTFIIFMVVKAFQQDVDLVSDTYYLDELAYQERIQEKSNLAISGLEIQLGQSGEEVIFTFPGQFKEATGEIHFYHPSRKLFDKRYAIALNDGNRQLIAKGELVKGRFKVRISWKAGDTSYFQEKEIFLK